MPRQRAMARGEGALARVAKGRVAQVMPEGDGLGEVLVQAQRPRDAASDLRHFERVREAGAVVVPRARNTCGLRLEAPECLAVHDAVAVALVAGAQLVGLLGNETARGGVGKRPAQRREQLVLPPLGVCPSR